MSSTVDAKYAEGKRVFPLNFTLFQWLHGTVVRRVVDEINAVNLQMTKSCEDAASIGGRCID